MKKLFTLSIISILSLTLILSGCTPVANKEMEDEIEAKNEAIRLLEQEKKALEEKIVKLETEQNEVPMAENNTVLYTALQIINLIKEKDMAELSNYIHPTKGLRFTAYGHIDDEDQVFNANQLADSLNNSQTFTWGRYDGTGDPIDLSFGDYYDKFIYDADFSSSHIIGINMIVGEGNTLNNIEEFYPNAEFIEFHFKGFDPQYEGMDWKSLRLVFEEENGNLYLVGIIHDQWTI
jgi:hypothetical protein